MTTVFVLLALILGTVFGWKVYELCISLGINSLIESGDGVYIDESKGQLVFDLKTLERLGYTGYKDGSSDQ
jgi:Co/Zn/Cd efflux system component